MKNEELVDGYQTVPYQPGALFGGVYCLVVFPIHFNPNNSLLILLQISLIFMCTPALNNRVFLSRNYRLIVALWKFDVLKTNHDLP